MPYEHGFEVGDLVQLKGDWTYNGNVYSKYTEMFRGQIGKVEDTYPRNSDSGKISVLWPPEIKGDVQPMVQDAWNLEPAFKEPTEEEIAAAFGLDVHQVDRPSRQHLETLAKLVSDGEWAEARLIEYLGENWKEELA